jgi:hypothetical protein
MKDDAQNAPELEWILWGVVVLLMIILL